VSPTRLLSYCCRYGLTVPVWTGLESLGFGANLQHYNPLIDAPVAKQWDIPSEWRLLAQLVFGSPEGGPGEKSQKAIEERVKIYGKL
jgi:predicted oxidoreductase (fatty acid repression mutant protein)